MKAVLLTALNRIKDFWGTISISQKMVIGGLSVVAVAGFIGLMIWLNRPDFSVLYANLGPEDANRVVKALEQQQVPYVLDQEGTAIKVPTDKVHALRITMAGENLLTGQGIGFEIFDELKVGQTDFVQKINYRRALEGELGRTIQQFPNIESVRVHLVLPHRSLFIEEQQSPSASVMLKLAPGKRMEPRDVQAIINLITMSVEGLQKSHVSVADATTGKVLFEPEQESSLNGLTQTQYEHKSLVQNNLRRRIEELLMPVLGAGKVSATVNADLDFSQKTIRRELFDPEKTVVRSEQRSEESTQGNGNIQGGVPDPNFRGDGYTGSTSSQNANRETRTTNYEINKEEYNIVSTVGDINRLTIAVAVDGNYTKDAEGKLTYVPRSEEELTRIRQLISNAVGFDSARGDTIEVTNMPFNMEADAEVTDINEVITDYASRFGKPLMNAMLVFLFLILVVRPIVLALIRPKVEGKMLEGLEGLPLPEERLALEELDDEMEAATVSFEKIEDIKAHAVQLSEQNMDQALSILKGWLNEPSKSAETMPAKAA